MTESAPTPPPVSRRALLGGLGVGTAAIAAGAGWYAFSGGSTQHPVSAAASVASWSSSRGPHYFIGHRGCGDVLPEHTIPAYLAALGWGAGAIEISTSSTSDGVLICMHDLTYDRTTNLTGPIHAQSSAVLKDARVLQPQLGPAWLKPPLLPPVPRLEDVLKRLGGRAVLCIEPKRDADYPAVLALIAKYKLQKSVVIKLFHTSGRIAAAQAGGFPVFSYLAGNDTDEASIAAIARRLRRGTDYLVLPTSVTAAPQNSYLPDSLLAAALQTGLPVWVYPVHRRSEADHYFGKGVSGVVSSSIGYGTRATAIQHSDNWASDTIASGQLTRQPTLAKYSPVWAGGGVLTLRADSMQQFLTLGQFCPVPAATAHYRIDFQVRWDVLPADETAPIALVFGHPDDRYHETGFGGSDGYTASITAAGTLALYAHSAAAAAEVSLAQPVATVAMPSGAWASLRLDVTPQTITFSRLDLASSASISVSDSRFRGGYLHLGRGSVDGSLSVRSFRVSQTG